MKGSYFRYFIASLSFIVSVDAQTQNLVPNPGFEILKEKPCRAVSTFPDNISRYVQNWVAPTGGSSDIQLMVAVADSCPINLPNYGLTTHSGNVCAGLFTLGNSPRLSVAGGSSAYREYIQVKLTKKLAIGKIYYVELYASPFDAKLNSIASLYSNNLGCYFSTDSIYKQTNLLDQFTELNYTPQINQPAVMDKPGQWYKISGCFEAKDSAQFLTIGSFFSDQMTKYEEVDLRGRGAYYLIDDVSVVEASIDLPTLTLNDTTLCPGQSLTINLDKNGPTEYRWQDGLTAESYTIKRPGVYSVTATSGFCSVSDTFSVVQEPALRLPADTTVCRETVFLLHPVNSASRVKWNNDSQGLVLPVQESGVYWATSLSSTCPQVDSMRIIFADCPGTIPNVFTPNGDGKNDTFSIRGIDTVPWRLEVTNRWGKRVYKSEAYQNEWAGDGMPSGLYYYLLSSDALQKRFKGWVQIIR